MPKIFIDNIEDPRLEAYRNLRTRNLTQFSAKFVVESKLLTQRLLRSDYEVESVLIDDIALPESGYWLPEDVTAYIVPRSSMSELLGFNFHRGVLGCGKRKRRLPATEVLVSNPEPMVLATGTEQPSSGSPIQFLASNKPTIEATNQSLDSKLIWTGVYLVGVQDPENMGQIARNCSALGVRDLIIGPECVDPFARRVLRVSMGCMFNLQISYASDPISFLTWANAQRIHSVATSLSSDSKPLEQYRRTQATLVVMGNEANGLPELVQKAATDRIKIDMLLGTDSLNVSVASGIILHYVTRLANS
jgi:tRNA G18 (ribose-2'-O)-methylase SpoU